MRIIFLTMLLSSMVTTLTAQTWASTVLDGQRTERRVIPKKARGFSTNAEALKNLLFSAPHERDLVTENSPVKLVIPSPDGNELTFSIVAYNLSQSEDLNRYPDIRTWYGSNPEIPGQTIFLDWTDRGFHASVSGGQKDGFFIDPLFRGNKASYQVYYRKDMSEAPSPFLCQSEVDQLVSEEEELSSPVLGDCVLRQYTVAISATPEYTNYHGATSATQSGLVQSAIVTSLNRINQVFTRDLSLRLELIANNDQLYFYSAADNPFTSNAVSTLLNENTDVINDRLGEGSYDLGHVYTQGGNNGIARLRSGCSNNWPGAGATRLGAPEGDPFNIDYVAHEIGHQLGGNHTQNNSCNYSSSAGMEPGSASTIMGYAGICSPNVQSNSDDYFHGRSIQEITTFLELNNGGSCATIINTSLDNPVLTGDIAHTIPFGTPLQLRASGSGNGNLFYTWEQYDVEQGPMPPESTSPLGPLFRSFPPTNDSFRYLPALPAVMDGFDPVWEELPQVGRDIDFRLTTRNTNAAYGCASELDVTLTVDGTNGPFEITDPATGNQWSAGQTAQVQWDVAGTDGATFASPTVDILITTDNGINFTLLASAVPNTGFAEVLAPTELTNNAKILVRSTDNVFYNVSPEPFSIISSSGTPDVSLVALGESSIADCFTALDQASFSIMVNSIAGASEALALTLDGIPASVTATFSPAVVRPGGVFTLTLSGLSSLNQGTYNGIITASSSEASATINVSIEKISEEPGQGPIVVGPVGNSPTTRPTLEALANGMEHFEFQLSDAADFSNLLFTSTGVNTTFALPDYLSPLTQYYWRVRSRQASGNCAISLWSEANFTTGPCFESTSNSAPQPISSSGPPQIAEMTLDIPQTGEILDVDVVGLDITHTYVNDLRIELRSPSGTQVTLFDRQCGSDNNIFLNFDDEGTTPSLPCPPVAPGLFLPTGEDLLSVFDGESVTGNWTVRVTDLANQDGGSFNRFSLVTCLESISLPVTYLNFTANGREKDILLTWATETEDNNAGFYVERTLNPSTDGWEELGFVAAGETYAFVDETAKASLDYLYRLRQTDLDGQVNYSELRSARINGQSAKQLLLYPNPTSHHINYQFSIAQDSPTMYRLTDISGRQLLVGQLLPGGGTIAIESLPAGVYLLRINDGSTHRIIRL